MHAITSVLLCTTRWRHGRSRGETKYSNRAILRSSALSLQFAVTLCTYADTKSTHATEDSCIYHRAYYVKTVSNHLRSYATSFSSWALHIYTWVYLNRFNSQCSRDWCYLQVYGIYCWISNSYLCHVVGSLTKHMLISMTISMIFPYSLDYYGKSLLLHDYTKILNVLHSGFRHLFLFLALCILGADTFTLPGRFLDRSLSCHKKNKRSLVFRNWNWNGLWCYEIILFGAFSIQNEWMREKVDL